MILRSSRIFQACAIIFIIGTAIGAFAPRALGFLPAVIGLLVIACSLGIEKRTKIASYMTQNAPAFIWLGLFMTLCLVSTLWSVHPETSFDRAIKLIILVSLALFLPFLWQMVDSKTISFTMHACVWSWIIGLLIINIELYGHMPFYRLINQINTPDEIRLSQLNRQIVFLTLLFFLLYPIYLRKSLTRQQHLLKFLIPALTALMLLGTESQSAIMAFLIGTATLLFFPSWSKWGWMGLKLFLAAAMLLTPLIATFGFSYMAGSLSEYSFFQDSYAANRLEIWDMVIRRALENPLYGFGIESTRNMTFDVANLYHPVNIVLHPHNFAVQVWIEFGVLGACLTAGFLWWFVGQIEALPTSLQRSALPCFMGIMVIATTGYGLWQGWWIGTFFWFIATLSLIRRFSEDQGWLPITTRNPI